MSMDEDKDVIAVMYYTWYKHMKDSYKDINTKVSKIQMNDFKGASNIKQYKNLKSE